MNSFFKMFFASLLSLIVFMVLAVFLTVGVVGSLASTEEPKVADRSVLEIDLSQAYSEREQSDLLGAFSDDGKTPGLPDLLRLIDHARTDDKISGIIVKANGNANGFAASNELRNALLNFRSSKKFVLAHGDVVSQSAYFVAGAADKVYVNPSGSFEWKGFAVSLFFVKKLLDRLQIQPQIFYAGKFKSATEIFRTNKMTPENREQTIAWLGDLYDYFLRQSAAVRKLDTATLRQLSVTGAIRTPQDALSNKLIDGVKYDDEIKSELKRLLDIGKTDKINLVSVNAYNGSVNLRQTGSNRIAVILAEGNIVDGKGSNDDIGGNTYRAIIRKARLDKSIKAIVMRVNSGGGSALASENIWRELQQAKADGKPVVVSFGDVAASGGYYISCGADSIFASPNTLTGSIGVFSIIPNMEGFFQSKLGITFDAVTTGPFANGPSSIRPLTEAEKALMQADVDRIYLQFKQRVATGRKKDIAYIDSIAQGRVWSGQAALRIGLVDRIGNLQDAISSAARLAKLTDYGLRQYPETENWLNGILNRSREEPEAMLKEKLGTDNYKVWKEMLRIKQMTGSVQARLPYEFVVR